VLWLALTPAAFFFLPVAYVMIVVGAIFGFLSRVWFARVARWELGSDYSLYRLIPFYDLYFFVTRINHLLFPALFWVLSFLFVTSGGISLFFHGARDVFDGVGAAGGPAAVAPAQRPPPGSDADFRRLLGGKTKEARALLLEVALEGEPSALAFKKRVDNAYKNGAKAVTAVGLGDDDDDEQFVITLPDEAAERKRFFTWYQKEIDPQARDTGQAYLRLPEPG
jgi:hypothetical protein